MSMPLKPNATSMKMPSSNVPKKKTIIGEWVIRKTRNQPKHL